MDIRYDRLLEKLREGDSIRSFDDESNFPYPGTPGEIITTRDGKAYIYNGDTGEYERFEAGGLGGGGTTEPVKSMFNVGAIKAGQTIMQGTTITELVKEMLLDVFHPSYVAPSFSLNSNQSNGQEVGKVVNLTLTLNYNKGAINGVMGAGGWEPSTKQNDRGGAATKYVIDGNDKGLVNSHTINSYVLQESETFNASVDYSEGPQPKDSEGNDFESPLAAGTGNASRTITAIYPYFWGKIDSPTKPAKGQYLIDAGNKVVANSSGTIVINFGSSSTDWVWFAIPANNNIKTSWYVDDINNGGIGGGANLFDTSELFNINSPSLYWNGVAYNIYMSNYPSAISSPMEIRN